MEEIIEKIRLKFVRKLLIRLNFGYRRPERSASLGAFKEDIVSAPEWSPIFVLSTGRSGTAWLSEYFRKIKSAWVAHSYAPEFVGQGRFAYEVLAKRGHDADILDALGQMYLAGREEVMLRCYERSLQFIETNNRITFLCWALAKLFPNARFIHLTRDPFDFIRSGLSRGWYESTDSHDHGRLRPLVASKENELWPKWARAEKIAWLWSETNAFIRDFSRSEHRDRVLLIRFEDLLSNNETKAKLLQFCGLQMPVKPLNPDKVINRRKHQKEDMEIIRGAEQSREVQKILAEVANELGYL